MTFSACLVVRFKSSVGSWLWLGLLLLLFGTQVTAADLAMSWNNGRLETTGKVSQSASRIIDVINEQRFDDALEQIENLELDDTDRGHLALALAASRPQRARAQVASGCASSRRCQALEERSVTRPSTA